MQYRKYTDYKPYDNIKELYKKRIENAKYIFDTYYDKFEYRNCPICGSNNFGNDKKFLERYEVCICNICNSYYVNPIPNQEILNIYYNKSTSVQLYTTLHKTQHDNVAIKDTRLEFIIPQIIPIIKHTIQINILEVGCNTGNFIYALKSYLESQGFYNIVYYGIDLDKMAIQIANEARNKNDSNVMFKNMAAEELKNLGVEFDIVIGFDIMEHLIDPNMFCSQIYNTLKPNGLFLFAVPNSVGITETLLPYHNDKIITSAIFPPMHLNGFSTQNINLFAYKNNFALKFIDTKGIFDVSILELCKEQNIDKKVSEFIECSNDSTKAFLQHYTTLTGGGGYMRCVFKKHERDKR